MAGPKYDDATTMHLMRNRLPFTERDTTVRKSKEPLPYTTAGVPGLLVRDMPYLQGRNTKGFVLASPAVKEEMANRTLQPNVFVSPDQGASTIAHETEHLLARQNLGFPQLTRDKFEELVGDSFKGRTKAVNSFLGGLQESLPYLQKKYGIKNAYMDPEFIKEEGRTGLYEIFATLAGAESSLGVDLTKDPELRKTLFKDRNVREAYNAVTGLRQTRTDARDLPSYTRLPEKEEKTGTVDKLKKLIGFANGGRVDNAGNTKLI